jgi:hypothetical protein
LLIEKLRLGWNTVTQKRQPLLFGGGGIRRVPPDAEAA